MHSGFFIIKRKTRGDKVEKGTYFLAFYCKKKKKHSTEITRVLIVSCSNKSSNHRTFSIPFPKEEII